MGTILTILVVAAVIGGLLGLMGGGTGDDAAAGAIGGAMYAGSCIFQLVLWGLMAMAGLWVLSLIF